MPRFRVEFDTDNAAFDDPTEISKILRDVASVVEDEGVAFQEIALYDSNGNRVGLAERLHASKEN